MMIEVISLVHIYMEAAGADPGNIEEKEGFMNFYELLFLFTVYWAALLPLKHPLDPILVSI